MKKIYLILLVLIGISVSCTKNFEDFNTDKKHPTEVPPGFLFSKAQKYFGDQEASTNVNLNIWKLVAQYWTETTYTDESNYDIINRTIPDNTFRTYYRDVLADLYEAKKILEAEQPVGEIPTIVRQNKLYLVDLMTVYTYSRLVDIFGNVPYTQAIDINNVNPVYDDAYAIYQDLFARLNQIIAGLDAGNESFGTDDLYFGGDVSQWLKFANTLKVKMAITIADADNNLAKTAIEEAYANAFQMGELCDLKYPGGSMSNPLYQDLVQSGRNDFVPANTIVDMMNTLEDPRRDNFFEINGDEYRGGIYGESNSFSQYSHIADPIQAPDFPMVILDYTELAFYLAEAAERGYNVGNTAEYYYNEGITSSILQWHGTEAEAADYLAKPEVAYATAEGNWKQKIGTQAWLALYIRGLEGWTTWRRLDFPVLNLPPAPETDDGQVPKRFTYPVNEQTLNSDNYYQAADAMGGDLMSVKLFWDKF
jgi:hypothetical protein